MTTHAETSGGPVWEMLLVKLLDGVLTESESRQLEQQMQASGELRRQVLDLLHVNACLEWEFNRPAELERLPPMPQPADVAPAQPKWWTWQRLRPIVHHSMTVSLILAALTVTIIVLSLALIEVPAWHDRGERPAAVAFVANVSGTRDAVWRLEEGAAPPTQLTAGALLELQSGLIEVELFAGTRAVLEGPLRATVLGDNSLALDLGTATFRVPREAIGFRVETPSVGVVDLGTEFGLHVDPSGAADVHVFDGEVAATPTADAGGRHRLLLSGGRAARFEAGSVAATSSSIPRQRFAMRLHSTSVTSQRFSHRPAFRLLDLDRDGLGDEVGNSGDMVAVGEWNGDDPNANVGRVWITFLLSDADRHNIEHGRRVTAILEVANRQGVELSVSAIGMASPVDYRPVPADYQREGELLAEQLLAKLPRSGGRVVFDVTEFAQRMVAQGEQAFALRLQVDAPALPNDDDQRDNILVRSGGEQRPSLLIQTPRREYRAEPTVEVEDSSL